MELIGEEKKIHDLFRELRVEDKRFAPRFAAVWSRTQARANRSSRVFKLAFVAATVLLAFALFSLPWWSNRWPSTQTAKQSAVTPPVQPNVVAPDNKTSAPENVVVKNEPPLKPPSINRVHNVKAVVADNTIRDAAVISKWESPTSTLLSSPADEVFSSLPQLNENATELKSFLPGRNN